MTELRKLAEAATPGPWEAEGIGSEWFVGARHPISGANCSVAHLQCHKFLEADATYIAAANPKRILDLLDELRSTLGRAKNAESIMVAASDERDALTAEVKRLKNGIRKVAREPGFSEPVRSWQGRLMKVLYD